MLQRSHSRKDVKKHDAKPQERAENKVNSEFSDHTEMYTHKKHRDHPAQDVE